MTSMPLWVVLPRSNESSSHGSVIQVGSEEFILLRNPTSDQIQQANSLKASGKTAGVFSGLAAAPQALFFDMDGTIIAEESLVEISKAAGLEHEIGALTEKAMAGGMDFSQSLRMRLALLKGMNRSQISGIKPTLHAGMINLAKYAQSAGIKLFLVSGGFVDLAGPLAANLGFEAFAANQFEWNGDRLSGDVVGEIIDGQGKLRKVQEWCKIHGFDPVRCMAIGDGANDLPMMKYCGASVGFLPKKVLWHEVAITNQTGDHSFLLEILRTIAY